MLINPKIMSFGVQFGCRWYPEWVFYSLVGSFKVVFCFGGPAGLYGSAPLSPGPIGSSFPWVSTHPFVWPGRCDLFSWGGQVLICCHLSIFVRLRRL